MENTKSEKTGQKPTNVQTFRDTIESLDAKAPKIEQIDYSLMNYILGSTNFQNCKTTMDALNLFYERLWAEIIFKMEDQIHVKDREIGRLILQVHEEGLAKKKAESEADTLRKRVQEQGN